MELVLNLAAVLLHTPIRSNNVRPLHETVCRKKGDLVLVHLD